MSGIKAILRWVVRLFEEELRGCPYYPELINDLYRDDPDV